MATKTRIELAAMTLEALGVKAAGQSASAEDTATVVTAIDGILSRLKRDERAPFAVDSVPDWAWAPLRDMAAYAVRSDFGLTGERLGEVLRSNAEARSEWYKQTAGKHDPRIRARARYF